MQVIIEYLSFSGWNLSCVKADDSTFIKRLEIHTQIIGFVMHPLFQKESFVIHLHSSAMRTFNILIQILSSRDLLNNLYKEKEDSFTTSSVSNQLDQTQ